MRAYVDLHTAGQPYTPRIAATEIVDKLRANDPELLARWLDEQAVEFVIAMLSHRERSARSHTAQTASRGAFKDAVEQAERGDTEPLRRRFLDMPMPRLEDGTSGWKLGELGHGQLMYVSQDYKNRAHANNMWAAFTGALAKRVRTGTVAGHFTEDQLAALWGSLTAA